MIAYIRLGLVLLALGLSAWGGWKARAWLQDSRDLRKVEAERDAAIQRERDADARAQAVQQERDSLETDLTNERAKSHERLAPIIKRIPVYIDRNDCGLKPDGVRALNAARGAEDDLPEPSASPAGDLAQAGQDTDPAEDPAH